MPAFRPITTETELPPKGTTRESWSLDLKATQAPTASYEMAKDVAAFANSVGGTIVVGAAEAGKGGPLAAYVPLEELNARALLTAYSEAVRDRCYPPPVHDVRILEHDGKFVVVVNVWPFPAQAVGVRLVQAERLVGDEAYVFPFRVGVDTRYLRPEQLPMLMLPEQRRVVMLLDKIPKSGSLTVTGSNLGHCKFQMCEVHPLENVLVVQRSGASRATHIPIDAIRSVWNEEPDQWRVVIEGMLNVPSKAEEAPTYLPIKRAY